MIDELELAIAQQLKLALQRSDQFRYSRRVEIQHRYLVAETGQELRQSRTVGLCEVSAACNRFEPPSAERIDFPHRPDQ
jgi:hypothetical protein